MKNKIARLLIFIALAFALKPGIALAYYDPELGRFIQPDTIIPDLSNPQSYNRYSYCLNNPLRYIDPTGHDPAFTPGMSIFEGLSIQQRYAASRTAAPIVAGVTVAAVTGGVAAPVLVGAGASVGFAAVGSGIIAGTAGDLASQSTQIGLGTRHSINGQEVAVSGLVGGAIGGTAAGVGRVISDAGTPQVASSPASQAAATVEQTATETGITAQNGTKITGFTGHGVDRAIGDGAGRQGVSPQSIMDSLKNPLKTGPVKTDSLGRPSQRFIGKTGEVVVNPDSGKVVSVNPTSSSKAAKLTGNAGQ